MSGLWPPQLLLSFENIRCALFDFDFDFEFDFDFVKLSL